ncbi:MAG: hypothetical protein GY864_08725 [Desulfobacterales bacterium]|nr:hypothetical protein [Desulfobacterales bacterium]
MSLNPGIISKISNTRRCDKNNIQEITRAFENINAKVKRIIDKILFEGARPHETESRELQLLLSMQAKLRRMSIDPGSGNTDATLYNNQCHRAMYLEQNIKEIDRRYKFKILG